jgi:hypothetical protein
MPQQGTMYPYALYCAYLHSWCDQQRAATSAETTVRLLQIGWNADVREAARKVKCPVLILHPDATPWCRSTRAVCSRA